MNQFDDVLNQLSQQEQLEESEAQWEHTTVNRAVSKLGIGNMRRSLIRSNKEAGRGQLLKLLTFREMFHTFPIHLESSRLRDIPVPEIGKMTPRKYRTELCPRYWEPARFKSFNRVPVVDLFNSLVDSLPEEVIGIRPVGLVFPRRGFKYGMIIHNDDSEQLWETGSAWVYKGTEARPARQYLQPFDQVLAAIQGSGWTPFNH